MCVELKACRLTMMSVVTPIKDHPEPSFLKNSFTQAYDDESIERIEEREVAYAYL
jgi:hypothetical protein